MKYIVYLFVVCSFGACTFDTNPEPEPIIDPPMMMLIKKDSLTSGEFLGFKIGEKASEAYSTAQEESKVSNLHIVSNIVTDFVSLKERLPLYNYILIDEMRGTDKGVQLTFKEGVLTGFFENSGKALRVWPEGENTSSSFRLGDRIESIYDKLITIKSKNKYAKHFERTMLLTKDVDKAYDMDMEQSPYWYFAYQPEDKHLNVVQLHLKDGKLDYIIVEYLRGG